MIPKAKSTNYEASALHFNIHTESLTSNWPEASGKLPIITGHWLDGNFPIYSKKKKTTEYKKLYNFI